MSTDLEKAEAVVRTIEEKRVQFVRQRSALCDERDDVALRAYIGDVQARKRLDEINTVLATRASGMELASLDAAKRAANKKVTAVKQAIGHEAAKQHFKQLHEQISALQEMAGPLDACLGRMVPGSMGGLRHEPGLKNPPLLDRCGECIGQIFLAMRAIDDVAGSDLRKGVVWPPGSWSRGHVVDLRKRLETTVQQYCGHVPSTRNFSGLIIPLVAAIKAAMKQHDEQTTNTERANEAA
jgi:hypothetical protein